MLIFHKNYNIILNELMNMVTFPLNVRRKHYFICIYNNIVSVSKRKNLLIFIDNIMCCVDESIW